MEKDEKSLKKLSPDLLSLEIGNRIVLENRYQQSVERITIKGEDEKVIKDKEIDMPDPDLEPQAGNDHLSPPDDEWSKAFDTLPLSGISKIFPLGLDKQGKRSKWHGYAEKASGNGLGKSRVTVGKGSAESTFDPVLVGEWLVKKGFMPRDEVDRKLIKNLPTRSMHLKELMML